MDERRNQPLPDGITRSHVLLAIAEFVELGLPAGYKVSHTYDVVHDGKAFPPPAIAALAAKALTGSLPEPGFRAGKGTKCFKILEDGGFLVRRKHDGD